MSTGQNLGAAILGLGHRANRGIAENLGGVHMVHAVALHGIFNAHQQQKQHENHLETIREVNANAEPGSKVSVRHGDTHTTYTTRSGSEGGGGGDVMGGLAEAALGVVTGNPVGVAKGAVKAVGGAAKSASAKPKTGGAKGTAKGTAKTAVKETVKAAATAAKKGATAKALEYVSTPTVKPKKGKRV